MKPWKYRSVRLATCLIILAALAEALALYALQYLLLPPRGFFLALLLYGGSILLLYMSYTVRLSAKHRVEMTIKERIDTLMNDEGLQFLYPHYLAVYVDDLPIALEYYLERYFHKVQSITQIIAMSLALGIITPKLWGIVALAALSQWLLPLLFRSFLTRKWHTRQVAHQTYHLEMTQLIQQLQVHELPLEQAVTRSQDICHRYLEQKIVAERWAAGIQTSVFHTRRRWLVLGLVLACYEVLVHALPFHALLAVPFLLNNCCTALVTLKQLELAPDTQTLAHLERVEMIQILQLHQSQHPNKPQS